MKNYLRKFENYILSIRNDISRYKNEKPFEIIILSIALVFLLSLYFTIPAFYNYKNFNSEIQKKVSKDFKLDLKNISSITYLMIPTPHFLIEECDIHFLNDSNKILKAKNLKINIFSKNLHKKEKIELKNIRLNKIDLDLQFNDIKNFYNHLKNNISKPININNSNIFFRDQNKEIISTIHKYHQENEYILDPHTAVGVNAAEKTNLNTPIICLACAHPAKFSKTIQNALGIKPKIPNELEILYSLETNFIEVNSDQACLSDVVLSDSDGDEINANLGDCIELPCPEDVDNDGEPDDVTVTIIPNVLAEEDIVIYNVMTPNGDGLNDIFMIENIDRFPDNKVQIFNRWGIEVFSTEGYSINNDNVFRGFSDGRATVRRGERLPTGTYYYMIEYADPDSGQVRRKASFLYIN